MKAEMENLRAEWHALERRWREVHEGWNDPVAWRFEREFVEPLSHATNKIILKTGALAERLERVRARINH